jgi:hypothetical protein
MNTQQTAKEYLKSLEKQIEAMDPLERVCSHVVLVLGRCVAELLNRHDYQPIAEMEQVCADIFKQARLAKEQTVDIIQ